MPPTDSIHAFLDAAASVVIPLVCLVMTVRAVTQALPFRVPLRFLGWALFFILVVAGAEGGIDALGDDAPGAFIGGWFGVGLVAFVVQWWHRTAEVREKRSERLRQARGHERRRAQPPLPHGPNPAHHGGRSRHPTKGGMP